MSATLLLSILIWGGALWAFAGLIGMLVPRVLGLRSRGAAVVLVLSGALITTLGFALPGGGPSTPRTGRLLDAYLPTDNFRESHAERIHASPGRVFAALHAVAPVEIAGFMPLMWMRSPRAGLTPQEQSLVKRPILELMMRQDFVILAERPGDEIVVGTIGQFWASRSVRFRDGAMFRAFRDPRYAKVAMNFHVRDEGGGWSRITTETRVACPDPVARRKFDRYWRVIYPGSSIIRAQWLQAIKRRAERPRAAAAAGASPPGGPRPHALRR